MLGHPDTNETLVYCREQLLLYAPQTLSDDQGHDYHLLKGSNPSLPMHIQAISYFPLQLFTDQTPSGLVLSSIPSGATHAVQGALRQQRNISLSSMRQRRPRVYPGRASAQRERRAWKRLLGFVALIAATVALPVLLTLRGNGGGSSGSSGSTNDNAFFAPRDADLEARDDWDASHWRGIAKSIPRVPRSQLDIHVVFSTDCSLYQNYQSILLFQSAEVCYR